MKTHFAQHTTHQKIIDYFEGAGLDYYTWSKSFNMHFGYYRWGMNPFDLEAMLNQMNEEVRKRLKLETCNEPVVLDLGCGLGTASRYMARKNPDASFYGITVTPWQVKFGKELNEAAKLSEQVFLVESDFADMPMMSASADAAYAIESACYAKGADKRELIKEIHRVLRPGSRLVIADGFRKHSRKLPGWLDRVYKRNMECWALEELADIQRFLAILREEGFTNIQVEDASWKVAPSFAHVPKTVFKFFWNRWRKGERKPLSKARRNNVLAPLLGMLMGLSRRHFGYYIITAEKEV